MSLLTTCTAANRVVEEVLTSTFRRQNVLKSESEYGYAYILYTRIRTKRYKYVGLTKSAAQSAANARNAMYCRKVFEWVWDRDQHIWKYDSSPTNRRYIVIPSGQATASQSHGDAYEVNVSVNEEITIPFRNIAQGQTDELPYPWTEFEADPGILTNAFKGFVESGITDFNYEE